MKIFIQILCRYPIRVYRRSIKYLLLQNIIDFPIIGILAIFLKWMQQTYHYFARWFKDIEIELSSLLFRNSKVIFLLRILRSLSEVFLHKFADIMDRKDSIKNYQSTKYRIGNRIEMLIYVIAYSSNKPHENTISSSTSKFNEII